jgi:hypothetical protein
MALDPRIVLGLQTPDISALQQGAQGALQSAGQIQQLQQSAAAMEQFRRQEQDVLEAREFQSKIRPFIGKDPVKALENIKNSTVLDDDDKVQITNAINAFAQGNQAPLQALDDLSNRTLGSLRPQTADAINFNRDMQILEGALDDSGQLKPVQDLTAEQRIVAIDRGLLAREGTKTVAERAIETPGKSKKLAGLRSLFKEAETIGKEKGDIKAALNQLKSALPGLKDVVGDLKTLSDKATFTLTGKAFNEVAKQFGYDTSGGTARASMISMINNQVLPLLRPTFGAQFTEREGKRLEQAFSDVNAPPDARRAALDAFLAQIERNIEAKERELEGGLLDVQSPPQSPVQSPVQSPAGMSESEADAIINEILSP